MPNVHNPFKTIQIERNGRIWTLSWNKKFDPVITPIVIGGMVAGTLMQGQAASQEAKGQQAIANYNAAVSEQQAGAIENQTAYKQKLQAEEAARTQSTLEAGLGASGAVTTEGSPLLLQATQAAQSEQDILMTGYQGQTAAAQARSQAAGERMQADVYGQKARNVANASYINAGTTALSGFGQAGYFGPKTQKSLAGTSLWKG